MKHLSLIMALVAGVSACSVGKTGHEVNQQCEFDEAVCATDVRIMQSGIAKFRAKGGMYIIKDMDTGETLENTSIDFDENTVYETFFSKIAFANKTTPERLLNKYMNLVKTSGKGMHRKLRENVNGGTGSTGRKANVENAEVSGITSTTEKGSKQVVITTFLGHFKQKNKTYAYVFVMDEPRGLKQTYGWQSAGWNVVPTAGKVIENIVK